MMWTPKAFLPSGGASPGRTSAAGDASRSIDLHHRRINRDHPRVELDRAPAARQRDLGLGGQLDLTGGLGQLARDGHLLVLADRFGQLPGDRHLAVLADAVSL